MVRVVGVVAVVCMIQNKKGGRLRPPPEKPAENWCNLHVARRGACDKGVPLMEPPGLEASGPGASEAGAGATRFSWPASRMGSGRRGGPSPRSGWAASRPGVRRGRRTRRTAFARPARRPPRPDRSGRRWRCAIPRRAQDAGDHRQLRGVHEAALGMARLRPGVGEHQEQRSRQPSGSARSRGRASSVQRRRLGGTGPLASPPSGTRRDSREQMPFSNTSQAIRPASGCAAASAWACSPPPKPTSIQSGAERRCVGHGRRGSVSASADLARASAWPRRGRTASAGFSSAFVARAAAAGWRRTRPDRPVARAGQRRGQRLKADFSAGTRSVRSQVKVPARRPARGRNGRRRR